MAETRFRTSPYASRKISLGGVVLFFIFVVIAFSGDLISLSLSRLFSRLFSTFFSMFFAVFREYDLLYAMVPIYINWISTDYFQERRGTSLGNAATNGFTGLWVGADWIRASHHIYTRTHELAFFFGKIVIAVLMLTYGVIVIYESMKGRHIAHYIGRVREMSFFAIMVTAIIYEIVPFNRYAILALILFFPVFYGLVEFLEYYVLPVPGTEVPIEKET